MDEIDYIEIIGNITGGSTKGSARFKSQDSYKGQLSFGQPYLIGSTWNVDIEGVNVNGGSISQQTIEIEIPLEDVQAASSGDDRFYWGNVMVYIAKAIKKKLCPNCF
jgi:hypothetical protein